jgi:sporulation-control protein spo0M
MQRYTIFFITANAVHVSGGETAQNIDNNKEY